MKDSPAKSGSRNIADTFYGITPTSIIIGVIGKPLKTALD